MAENLGLVRRLRAFSSEKRFAGRKGAISVALVVTEHARDRGLPLRAEELVTEGGGQVLGLGKSAVQAVLARHGITRMLAHEGGRTSRGSLNAMRDYVAALNGLAELGMADLDAIERFWVSEAEAFFAAKPIKLEIDASKGLRAIIRSLMDQAIERQKAGQGVFHSGALLQHLVGAKLECALGPDKVKHHAFTTADAPSQRSGDFLIGNVAIHVTTAPGEAVIAKCAENLRAGLRPILVTVGRRLEAAESLAANVDLEERIDFFELEQFIALNLHEWGAFEERMRRPKVLDLVEKYNAIVEAVETDPSLRIEFKS